VGRGGGGGGGGGGAVDEVEEGECFAGVRVGSGGGEALLLLLLLLLPGQPARFEGPCRHNQGDTSPNARCHHISSCRSTLSQGQRNVDLEVVMPVCEALLQPMEEGLHGGSRPESEG